MVSNRFKLSSTSLHRQAPRRLKDALDVAGAFEGGPVRAGLAVNHMRELVLVAGLHALHDGGVVGVQLANPLPLVLVIDVVGVSQSDAGAS